MKCYDEGCTETATKKLTPIFESGKKAPGRASCQRHLRQLIHDLKSEGFESFAIDDV